MRFPCLPALSLSTLEQRRPLNVEQALRATPGVNVNSAGGVNLSTLYIRDVGDGDVDPRNHFDLNSHHLLNARLSVTGGRALGAGVSYIY